jgi:Flp pilus assembly protein TadD
MLEMNTLKALPRKRGSVSWALLFLTACAVSACIPEPGGFTTEVVDTNQAVSPKTAAMLRIADATKASGDSRDAADLYQHVVQDHPELIKARTSLAEALLDKGDPALALRNFRDARKLDPSDLENTIGAGQALMALHKPSQAQKEFQAALQKDPANVKALNGLGVSLDAAERHEEARRCYQKALAAEPQNGAVRNNYGLSLALSGLHEQAVAELLPLVKEEGQVGRKARQNLAMSYALRGDFVNASRWSQVDLKPDDIRNDLRVYGSIARD